MRKTLLSIILAIGIFDCVLAQYDMEELKSLSNVALIKEGNNVMEIKLPSIEDGLINLNDQRGKYLFINIWATWCAPCLKNMPFFEKLMEIHKQDNIEFVFVSIDGSEEKWRNYVAENNMKGIQLFAPKGDKTKPICYFINRVYEKDGQIESIEMGIPRYILIDPNGVIVKNNLEDSSKKKIKRLLHNVLKK